MGFFGLFDGKRAFCWERGGKGSGFSSVELKCSDWLVLSVLIRRAIQPPPPFANQRVTDPARVICFLQQGEVWNHCSVWCNLVSWIPEAPKPISHAPLLHKNTSPLGETNFETTDCAWLCACWRCACLCHLIAWRLVGTFRHNWLASTREDHVAHSLRIRELEHPPIPLPLGRHSSTLLSSLVLTFSHPCIRPMVS